MIQAISSQLHSMFLYSYTENMIVIMAAHNDYQTISMYLGNIVFLRHLLNIYSSSYVFSEGGGPAPAVDSL